jgi:hypothetical protein
MRSDFYFDIVYCTGSAYQFVLKNAQYIFLKIAVPAFVVQVVTVICIYLAGVKSPFLISVAHVPALLIEGWFAAQLIRFYAYNEKWPYWDVQKLKSIYEAHGTLPKELQQKVFSRSQVILSGMVAFALIGFLMNGLSHYLNYMGQSLTQSVQTHNTDVAPSVSSTNGIELIIAFGLVIISIWSVRYMFVHVPLILGYKIRDYLRPLKIVDSFRLIGISLVCTVPVALIFTVLFGAITQGDDLISTILLAIFQSASKMIVCALVTVAVSSGVMRLLQR